MKYHSMRFEVGVVDRGFTFFGQCAGKTKAGVRCKRTVVFANNLCSWHGGDSSEFMKARAERLKEKARRRIERIKRKQQRASCD